MVKTSKRAKNFQKKGGAAKMLEKGTITKKGKVKTHKKKKADPAAIAIAKATERRRNEQLKLENERQRKEGDFTSETNLGDLDLDSFLKSVADDDNENDENRTGEEEGNEDDVMDDVSSDDESDAQDIDIDSDDEDIDAAEERMKAEMEKLADTDPDFHEYLQQNDKSMLDFQETATEENKEDENDAMAEGQDEEGPKKNDVLVNAKVLKTLEYGAFESRGVKPLRKIIAAYVSACHMADTKDQNEDGEGRMRVDTRKKYLIESSTVFDKLMVTCLSKCHEEFHYHLIGKGASVQSEEKKDDDDSAAETESDAIDQDTPINPKTMNKSIRWMHLKMSIQSFVKATLHLLSEAKEAKLLSFIIKSLGNYLPYLSAFPRLAKAVLKTLTLKWASTSDGGEDQTVRVNAFLRIRQLAVTQPFPFIEECLKSTYLAYAKAAKFANAATVTTLLPQLTFMGNCVVELFTLDFASSYQHAFIYIRQLALHLRTAMQKKTPESFRVVYCWQYMHCLKLWTAVLAASCGKAGEGGDDEMALMKSLVYPLVEVIFGVARLIPTTRHLPLRLHCVRYLQQLSSASEIFIPTTSILLDVFDLKEVTMTPKRTPKRGGSKDVRGVRLPLILKLPKEDTLRSTEQLDACLGETFLLLNREVEMYKYSAGCPEFTVRICQRLRKFSKDTRNGKYRAYAKGNIEMCEKNAKFATFERSKLEVAPKDIRRIEVLKPNNAPSMGERYEMAIAKERRLEAASQPALSKAAKEKAQKAREDAEREKEEVEEKEEESDRKRKQDASKGGKNKKKKLQLNEADLKNVGALKEEDEVQEGIDWSASEAESDDDSGDESSSS